MSARKSLSVAAVVLACGLDAANAQEKVWKHGVVEAKSDAGFIAMVDKGGFAEKRGSKVELLQIKAGATLIKALIAGEIDSVEVGAGELVVAAARGTGVKIVGCIWPGLPPRPRAKRFKAAVHGLAGRKNPG